MLLVQCFHDDLACVYFPLNYLQVVPVLESLWDVRLMYSGCFRSPWRVDLQCMFSFAGLGPLGQSLPWTANVTGRWLLMNHTNSTRLCTRETFFFQICKPIRCTISSSPWLMHMLHSYSVSPASELQCAVCFVFEVQQCWSQLPNTIKLCVVVAFLRGDLWNSHGHLLNVFEGHNIWWIMALIWQSCFLFSSSCSLRHFHIHFEWKSTYGFESCEMVHIYGGEMQRPLEHMVMTFIHIHVSADWLLNGLM